MPKFKKVSADEARAKRKDHVAKRGSSEIMLKGSKSPKSWNPDERSAVFTMSSETVDRYGDIVVQAGIDTGRFMENPQGLLFHDSRTWPCGLWSDINKILNGRPRRTEGKLTFLPEGADEDADRAARHVAAGTIRTVSIGFIPNWDDVEMILDDEGEWCTGFKFNSSELLECSLVPIPAQPDALIKDAGGDMRLSRDLIEHVIDNYAKTADGLLLPMDEYLAAHKNLEVPKSFHIVRGLDAPKTVPKSALKLEAATNAEAEAFRGVKVQWDPAHPANKGDEFPSFFANCVGEVISGWIVPSGEFKGVFALDVEWSEKDGHAVGMYRGLKAERVLLLQAKDGGEMEPGDEPEDEEDAVEPKATETEVEEEGKKPCSSDEDQTNSADTEKAAKPLTLKLDVDTTAAEAAAERVESLFSKIAKKFPLFFQKEASPTVVVHVEPTIAPPAAAPTAEAIRAAIAAAQATKQRLESKSLL